MITTRTPVTFRRFVPAALALLGVLAAAPRAHAYDYRASRYAQDGTSNDGKCSLREAIIASQGAAQSDCPATGYPGTPVVWIDGQINLFRNWSLDITSPVTIRSADPQGNRLAINGDKSWFNVRPGGNLQLIQITLTGFHRTPIVLTTGNAVSPAVVTLSYSEISNNDNSQGLAGRTGGIVVADLHSQLHIYDSVLQNNSGTSGGVIQNMGQTEISRSSLTGNFAQETGGAIYNAGVLNITNVTISDNVQSSDNTGGSGGGIFNSGGYIMLDWSTVTANAVKVGTLVGPGGGIASQGGTIKVGHSIIYGNTSNDCSLSNTTFTSLGYNDIESCTFTRLSSDLSKNPLLDVLSAYSPWYPRFHPPKTGSPVVDAIPTNQCTQMYSDELGNFRPWPHGNVNGCDIGAIEKDSDSD